MHLSPYPTFNKFLFCTLIVLALGASEWAAQGGLTSTDIVQGDGVLEADEIDVVAVHAGRLQMLLVDEGAMVVAGQTLAQIETDAWIAARAALDRASAPRDADDAVAQPALQGAERTREPLNWLLPASAVTDAERAPQDARVRGPHSAQVAPQPITASGDSAAAQTRLAEAPSASLDADEATAQTGQEAADGVVVAPVSGRVQQRLALPGDRLSVGTKVLRMVDMSTLRMGFSLPEPLAQSLTPGTEVRIVMNTKDGAVIPARATVAPHASQHPTDADAPAGEASKRMQRFTAQIDRSSVPHQLMPLQPGQPGVVWVKLDPQATWPAALALTPAKP